MTQRWAGYGLETGIAWPMEDNIDFRYRGYHITMDAVTDETLPTVRIYFDDHPYHDVFVVLRRFLSALAWMEGKYVRTVISGGGGARMRFGRTNQVIVVARQPYFPTIPEPTDEKALLALALYREGLGAHAVPYQFLSFFKILNILHRSGAEQRDWIETYLPALENREARERLVGLSISPADQARYLYEAGRCAVAHAYDSPLVDPDEVDDEDRLRRDLPIVRELAEMLMHSELGLSR